MTVFKIAQAGPSILNEAKIFSKINFLLQISGRLVTNTMVFLN